MQRKWVYSGAVLAAIALAGTGAFVLLRNGSPAAAKQAPQAAAMPAEVTLAVRLQAKNTIEVPVPLEGKVEKFHVEVGDEVYEGQLLAVIKSEALEGVRGLAELELERIETRVNNLESSIAAARLEASRAGAEASRVRNDYDRASRTFQRQKMLLAEGATPRRDFEKAEREFTALEAESQTLDTLAKQSEERIVTLNRELDAARKTLTDKSEDVEAAKTRVAAGEVVSPASGIVAARRGVEGDEVQPTMTDLFRIATDLTSMQAVAEPDGKQLAVIKQGQEAFIAVAESQELLPGRVVSVEEGRVTIEFTNPNPDVRPGATAQARIKIT